MRVVILDLRCPSKIGNCFQRSKAKIDHLGKVFLAQLPDILYRLQNAGSSADWRIATHTLKGSALAIGACKIGDLAKKLEPVNNPEQDAKRKKLLSGLVRAVNEFDEMARQLYPS